MPNFGAPVVFPVATAAPPRRTFLEMKSELARPYNPGDETVLAIAGDSINAAIRRYNRRLWPWDIVTDSLSFSANDDQETLSQTFKKPLCAYIMDSGRRHKRLAHEPYESFIERYSWKHDGGDPSVYTMKNVFRDGQMLIWPRPTSAYTIEVDYYARIPKMEHDDDPFGGPPESEEAIMAEADYIMATRRPGASVAIMSAKKTDAEVAWRELVAFAAVRGDNLGLP